MLQAAIIMNPKAGKEFLKIGIRCPFPLDDAAFILKLIHALLCRTLILNFSFLSKCWCLQLFLLMVIVSGSDTMEGPQEGMRLECAVQEHGGGCLLPRTRVPRIKLSIVAIVSGVKPTAVNYEVSSSARRITEGSTRKQQFQDGCRKRGESHFLHIQWSRRNITIGQTWLHKVKELLGTVSIVISDKYQIKQFSCLKSSVKNKTKDIFVSIDLGGVGKI